MINAVLRRFEVRVTGDPVWAGGGANHNVGVAVDQLPIELTPR